MMHEVNLLGVYVSPFAWDLALAAVGFLLLRFALARSRALRFLTRSALFEIALMIVSLLCVAYLP